MASDHGPASPLDAKSGRFPEGKRPPCIARKGGEIQAMRVLKRSAFTEARFDSGSIASPNSFTNDSVIFDDSEIRRSNDERAKSLCSWNSSVGDLASANLLTAAEAVLLPDLP